MKITKGAIISEPGSTTANKTGEWRTFRPIVDKGKCIKCGKCWSVCPDAAIKKTKEGHFEIDYEYCKGCLICVKECPVKCITTKMEEK